MKTKKYIFVAVCVVVIVFVLVRFYSPKIVTTESDCSSTSTSDMYSCISREIALTHDRIIKKCSGAAASLCDSFKSTLEIEAICKNKLGDPADQGSEYKLEFAQCVLGEENTNLNTLSK